MNGFSISVLVGRLAADPKFTPGKKQPDEKGVRSDDRAWARLAINKSGQNKDPDYFNISFWGKLARVAMDHTQKGKNILVLCEPRSWSKPRLDGSWENNVEFTCTKIVLGADAKAQGSFLQQMMQTVAPQPALTTQISMPSTPVEEILMKNLTKPVEEILMKNLTKEQLDTITTEALAIAEAQLAKTAAEDPFRK